MNEGEYCTTIKANCTPKDCPVEFCKWRDTVWAMAQLRKWAYETNVKPISTPSQIPESPQKPKK